MASSAITLNLGTLQQKEVIKALFNKPTGYILRIIARIVLEFLPSDHATQKSTSENFRKIIEILRIRNQTIIIPSIAHLYNVSSLIQLHTPNFFDVETMIQHCTKISEWADNQCRLVIKQYCQEALNKLTQLTKHSLIFLIDWKSSSTITTSELTTSAPFLTSIPVETVTSFTPPTSRLTPSESTSASSISIEVAVSTNSTVTSQINQATTEILDLTDSTEVESIIPETSVISTEPIESMDQSNSNPITEAETTTTSASSPILPHLTDSNPEESTQEESSAELDSPPTPPILPTSSPASSSVSSLSDSPIRIRTKLSRKFSDPEVESSVPDESDDPVESSSKRPRLESGEIQALELSAGTVLTILDRTYAGSTVVYVGPSNTSSLRRIIVMNEETPFHTHIYRSTRAIILDQQITHKVSIDQGTREINGTLNDLRSQKITYNKNIAVRITQIGSEYRFRLATAFYSWFGSSLVWIDGETAPQYLDSATKVTFYSLI